MSAREPVGIVGAGAFGAALARVVGARGGRVLLWGEPRRLEELPELPGVTPTAELARVAAGARLVVLAVPAMTLAELVRGLGDVVDGGHLIVHAAGAFVDGRRVSELIRAETCVKRVGAIAGPALPQDLADGRPCAVVVASAFDEVVAAARAALAAAPVLRAYGSRDLPGVEIASALTGAMTVAVGLADGIGLGAGPRAVLVTRAVAEIARLVAAAGGRERTAYGLAGLGNLLVRASSESSERSEDYRLGLALARGGPDARRETAGVRAAAEAVGLARRLGVRAPLLDAVHSVAREGVPVEQAAARLVETQAEEE